MKQDEIKVLGVTIGTKAPDFTANSTLGEIQISDYNGKWMVLFSHPGAFNPVCTSEFLSFAKMNSMFEAMNTTLIALNMDGFHANLAWIDSIHKESDVVIPFPVISDRMGAIAKKYGMIPTEEKQSSPVRNVFFIDPNQIIRAILVYPSTTNRNIDEILRIVEALQVIDE
jgi:peroxiredoxin (alkyl hydroperoxide reductase subunit C)